MELGQREHSQCASRESCGGLAWLAVWPWVHLHLHFHCSPLTPGSASRQNMESGCTNRSPHSHRFGDDTDMSSPEKAAVRALPDAERAASGPGGSAVPLRR